MDVLDISRFFSNFYKSPEVKYKNMDFKKPWNFQMSVFWYCLWSNMKTWISVSPGVSSNIWHIWDMPDVLELNFAHFFGLKFRVGPRSFLTNPNVIFQIRSQKRDNLLCDSRLEESPILMMRLSLTLPAELACTDLSSFNVKNEWEICKPPEKFSKRSKENSFFGLLEGLGTCSPENFENYVSKID